MNASEWEDLREEICTHLAIGHENGEAGLDTITRLVWVERHKIAELHGALMAKDSVAVAGLKRKRRQPRKLNNVLQWKLTAPRITLLGSARTILKEQRRGDGMWMQTACCEGYKVRGLQEHKNAGWIITTWPEGNDQFGNEHLVKDGVFYKVKPATSSSATEWQKARFGDVDLNVDPAETKAVLTLIQKWDARISAELQV